MEVIAHSLGSDFHRSFVLFNYTLCSTVKPLLLAQASVSCSDVTPSSDVNVLTSLSTCE